VSCGHPRWLHCHTLPVNELGDIQTEEPVHGWLTDAGVEVIRRRNARGVVVDVAHGTLDLVRRSAAVTTKPLVLSHTSLTIRPRPFTRLITPEHVRLVAGTGGMIGIWPAAAICSAAIAHACLPPVWLSFSRPCVTASNRAEQRQMANASARSSASCVRRVAMTLSAKSLAVVVLIPACPKSQKNMDER
jgi:microsomal dipeptidase-like Zn-dependent dipeptidase